MLHLREVGGAGGRRGRGPRRPGRTTSRPLSPRRGEGAFRLRPRKPFPPQPLDKYQLRETKRRLLQSLGGRLSPWACAHSAPPRQNPFCGE